MRKGISSFCGVVYERMGCSVRNGDVRQASCSRSFQDSCIWWEVSQLSDGLARYCNYGKRNSEVSLVAFETVEGGTKCIYYIKRDVVFLVSPGYVWYIYSVINLSFAWLNRQLFVHKSEGLQSLDPNQPDLFSSCLPDNAVEMEEAREITVQTITREMVENKKWERNNRSGRSSRTWKGGHRTRRHRPGTIQEDWWGSNPCSGT